MDDKLHMLGDEVRAIRQRAGLSLLGLANLLRISDRSTVHRWETGARPVSGPASLLLEMLDAGKLSEYIAAMKDRL